jgi:hypothetical protein
MKVKKVTTERLGRTIGKKGKVTRRKDSMSQTLKRRWIRRILTATVILNVCQMTLMTIVMEETCESRHPVGHLLKWMGMALCNSKTEVEKT